MEEELDLYQIWQAIAKRWRMILLIPLLAAASSAAVSLFYLTPQYQASTTLLVVRPTESAQILLQDIQVSRQLVDTYREIARSAAVLNKVIANLRLPYRTEYLRESVNVTAVRNTEIINISVTNPDPQTAGAIANEVARVFKSEVMDIYKIENVSLIDSAETPLNPVSPRVRVNVLVAFTLGLIAATGLALAHEFLDKTIKTPDDVQKYLQLPVLGIIPYSES